MIALGIRIWVAYGALGMVTAMLCASVPATAGAAGSASVAAAQQTRDWPSERPPRPLQARPVKFPPYEIRKLANGLQVVLVSQNEQPAVSVRMIVRAGAAQDPKGKMGLAMLTASLIDQGAASRTAEQIADEIDFVGGILGTGAGTDLTYINAVVMKDSLALALQLMADVVRRPTFAQDEIDRQRQQAMSGLKVAAEDPDTVASQVIDRLIYGFHPYGLPGSGTAESLAKLTRQDIVDYHKQFFVPNNALLAVVGDVERGRSDGWPGKGVRRLGGGRGAGLQADRSAAADQACRSWSIKPDAVQTEIRVGQLGIPRRHDEFLAHGSGREDPRRRGREPPAAGAALAARPHVWRVGGPRNLQDSRRHRRRDRHADRRDRRGAAAHVDEFWRLQRERVYDGELEGAQAYLAGHFPLTIETPDAIATQVLNQLFYELPLEELQTFPERVRSVSPDDVQRVARSYFIPTVSPSCSWATPRVRQGSEAASASASSSAFRSIRSICCRRTCARAAAASACQAFPGGGARTSAIPGWMRTVSSYQQSSSSVNAQGCGGGQGAGRGDHRQSARRARRAGRDLGVKRLDRRRQDDALDARREGRREARRRRSNIPTGSGSRRGCPTRKSSRCMRTARAG